MEKTIYYFVITKIKLTMLSILLILYLGPKSIVDSKYISFFCLHLLSPSISAYLLQSDNHYRNNIKIPVILESKRHSLEDLEMKSPSTIYIYKILKNS